MPPIRAPIAASPRVIAEMPASNTVTPPPGSSRRYTFIVRGRPPRTIHTPSATGSGPAGADPPAPPPRGVETPPPPPPPRRPPPGGAPPRRAGGPPRGGGGGAARRPPP